jgi:hypothetical protein
MAIVLIEGFDHVNTEAMFAAKGWSRTSGNSALGSAAGRINGLSVQHSANNGGSFRKTLASTYSTFIMGFGFLTNTRGANTQFIQLLTNGAAVVAGIRLNTSSFKLEVVNSAGTVIATGTTTINVNTWYYIELKIVVNGASGSCELHLNGVAGEIASTVGNFGSTNVGIVGCTVINVSGGSAQWDDIYGVDTSGAAPRNTFLGECRIEALYPTANSGTNAAWTSSSGTAHNDVDETAGYNSDTDYISDATPGDRSTFAVGSIAVGTGTIYGVQVNNAARKDDAGARTIAPVIRQGGSNYDGTTTAGLSTAYVVYSQIYNQDPTGTDWSIANVNGDEYGVLEVA